MNQNEIDRAVGKFGAAFNNVVARFEILAAELVRANAEIIKLKRLIDSESTAESDGGTIR